MDTAETKHVTFTADQQERVNEIVRDKLGVGRARWMRDAEAKQAALEARVVELEHQVTRLLAIVEWTVNPAQEKKQ